MERDWNIHKPLLNIEKLLFRFMIHENIRRRNNIQVVFINYSARKYCISLWTCEYITTTAKWTHKNISIIYLRIRFAVNYTNKLRFVAWSCKARKEKRRKKLGVKFFMGYQRTLYKWPSPACTQGFSTVISGGAENEWINYRKL